MRTSSTNAVGDFHPPMDEIERRHCREDLDKAEAGDMTPDEFFAKWADALRAHFAR